MAINPLCRRLLPLSVLAALTSLQACTLRDVTQAMEARKKRDSIMREFKRVDESIRRADSSIDARNKTLLDSLNQIDTTSLIKELKKQQ